MTENLQEFVDSRGVRMRVDRPAGIIRGVKILGLESRNGRTYLPEALDRAVRLYEDAKVNVNHPAGNPSGPRDYRDRIGAIRNVAVRAGEGLFADFHFNPKHALAEQLAWDAEHAPENVGFSHNVQAQTVRRGDRLVVEAITKVQSVDLVADPATTAGLFEAKDSATTTTGGETPRGLTVDVLRRDYPELVETLLEEKSAEVNRLRAEVERLTVLETVLQKRRAIRRLLDEHRLPGLDAEDPSAKTIVGERFIESLMAAPSDRAMRDLVEERAALVQELCRAESVPSGAAVYPQSRARHAAGFAGPKDVKAFVAAIT